MVDTAISEVVSFTSAFRDAARTLYDDAVLTAPEPLDRVSGNENEADAALVLLLEDQAPRFVEVTRAQIKDDSLTDEDLADLLDGEGVDARIEIVEGAKHLRLVASGALGISVATARVTANEPAPLGEPEAVSFELEIEFEVGSEEDPNGDDVVVSETKTLSLGLPSDTLLRNADVGVLALDVTQALMDALDEADLDLSIVAIASGDHLALVSLDPTVRNLTVHGGQEIGFSSGQSLDAESIAAAEVFGIRHGVSAQAPLKFDSIEDLNGLLATQNHGLPFVGSITKTADSLEFTLELKDLTFARQVDLDFGNSLDLGFASREVVLNLSGDVEAELAVNVDATVTVGVDVAGGTISLDTRLADLNNGRGVPLLVGLTAQSAPNLDGSNQAMLTVDISTFAQDSSAAALSVEINAGDLDGLSLDELALLLNGAIRAKISENEAFTDIRFESDDALPPVEVLVDRGDREDPEDDRLALLANHPAINKLTVMEGASFGFEANQESDRPDFQITIDGEPVPVSLDGAQTLYDARMRIDDALDDRFSVGLNAASTALRIEAMNSNQDAPPVFGVDIVVDALGIGTAAAALKILGRAETTVLEGGDLAGGEFLDRLYLKPGASVVDVTATITGSPRLAASLGILDLGVLAGEVNFTVATALGLAQPPNGSDKIRLNELLRSVSADSPTFSGSGALRLESSLLDGLIPAGLEVGLALDENGKVETSTPDLDGATGNFETLLEHFQNVTLADVVGVVTSVLGALESSDLGVLNEPLPMIGKSIRELLSVGGDGETSFTEEIIAAIESFAGGPSPQVLMDLRDSLEDAVGELRGLDGDGAAAFRDELLPQIEATVRRFSAVVGVGALEEGTEGRLVAAVSELRDVATRAGAESSAAGTGAAGALADGLDNFAAVVKQIADAIGSAADLGPLIERLLRGALGLAEEDDRVSVPTFAIVDADDATNGLQPAVVAELSLDVGFKGGLDFDFALPDIGPLTVDTSGDILGDFDANLTLGFAFDFATGTPYVLDTTKLQITGDVRSDLNVTVGLAGVSATLGGRVDIHRSQSDEFVDQSDADSVTLTQIPQVEDAEGDPVAADGGFIVVLVNGVRLEPGTDSDYTIDPSGATPRIDFTSPQSGAIVVDYPVVDGEPQAASITLALDPSLTRVDVNGSDAVGLADVFGAGLSNAFSFDVNGMLAAALDVAGNPLITVSDAVTVALSLEHPTPQIRAQHLIDAVRGINLQDFMLQEFDLRRIVAGGKQLLDVIDSGLLGVLEPLPLIGDGASLAESFLGDVRGLLDELDKILDPKGQTVEGIKTTVRDNINTAIGPILSRTVEESDILLDPGTGVFEITLPLEFEGDTISVPFDLGLDAVVFEIETEGALLIDFDLKVGMTLGVSVQDGFYFKVNPNDDAAEFEIGAELTFAPGTELFGRLFFLNLTAEDMGTSLSGSLSLDLDDPDNDGKLTFAEIAATPLTDLFTASASLEGMIDLQLTADVDGSQLPSISTHFRVGSGSSDTTMPLNTWSVSFSTADGLSIGTPIVEFGDVTLDIGSFFSNAIEPVLRSFNDFAGPLKPLVRFLNTEVPGVSNLASRSGQQERITFVTLAFLAGGGDNPRAMERARQASRIIDLVDQAFRFIDGYFEDGGVDAGNIAINFGSFRFGGDTPVDVPRESRSDPDFFNRVVEKVETNEPEPPTDPVTGQPTKSRASSVLKRLSGNGSGLGGLGLSIPLLTDPTNIFRLLAGQPADIIKWDIPRFDVEVPLDLRFGPLFGLPLFATVGVRFDAFLDLFLGFDTRGIASTGNFLDGLYFGDLRNGTSGPDTPEFGLGLEVAVGAELGAGPISVGIEAGIAGRINFDWNDPNDDGKLYLDELIDLFAIAPQPPPLGLAIPGMCVFDIDGRLSAFLRFNYKLGPFGGSKKLIDITIFRFDHSCEPPPFLGQVETGEPTLDAEGNAQPARFAAGTLVLNAGEFATRRNPGPSIPGVSSGSRDVSEQFFVEQTGPDTVTVRFTDLVESPTEETVRFYKGVQRIYFDGGVGDDVFKFSNKFSNSSAFSDLPLVLRGGPGADSLTAGSGNDVLFVDGSDKVVVAGDGNDTYVFGDDWGAGKWWSEGFTELGDRDTLSFANAVEPVQIEVTADTLRASDPDPHDSRELVLKGFEAVVGGAGVDTLSVPVRLGDWRITRQNGGRIVGDDGTTKLPFGGFEDLVGSGASETFEFADGALVTSRIDGGGGDDDTLDFGAYSDGLTLDRASSTVTTENGSFTFASIEAVVGGSGTDTLLGPARDATWNVVAANEGSFGDTDEFRFSSFENLTGASGTDTFLFSNRAKVTGEVRGTSPAAAAADADKIDLSLYSGALTFHLSRQNEGTIAVTTVAGSNEDVAEFYSVENLVGGKNNDIFVIGTEGSLSGSIDGDGDVKGVGAPRDRIDYRAWTDPVTVDLSTGTAEAINGDIAGGLTRVEDVIGGAANDSLTGNDASNYLVGNGGDDKLAGKGGNDVLWGDGEQLDVDAFFGASAKFELPDLVATAESDFPTGFDYDDHFKRVPNGPWESGTGDGADDLSGGDGDDWLFGGGGADIMLDGGAGDDYVDGGPGDEMTGSLKDAPDPSRARVLGGPGRDIVRGGAGHDVVRGGDGIDLIYGDDGDDDLFGDAGDDDNDGNSTVQWGQRLFGGEGRDELFAFAPESEPASALGDYLDGGAGGDFLFGNVRREILVGGSGNDWLHGDERAGRDYALNQVDGEGMAHIRGAADLLIGDGGEDVIFGGGGDDVLAGGADTDTLEGQGGFDVLHGGAWIDILVVDALPEESGDLAGVLDGHFDTALSQARIQTRVNQGQPDAERQQAFLALARKRPGLGGADDKSTTELDDNATDILLVNGSTLHDDILLAQRPGDNGANGNLVIHFTKYTTSERAPQDDGSIVTRLSPAASQPGQDGLIEIPWTDDEGNPLVEQFRVSGNAGDDRIRFLREGDTNLPAGIGDVQAIDARALADRSDSFKDFIGVLDGGSGNDELRGGRYRDRLDGGGGSDTLYGFGGDDRLWGNDTAGIGGETNFLYAGTGNDDLIGSETGTNHLFAWSASPFGTSFGVFVDGVDGELENTGINRMLGGMDEDHLYGGTGIDFLFGGGGENTLYGADGMSFESRDGEFADDEWKEYARESELVWYVRGTDGDDTLLLRFDADAQHHELCNAVEGGDGLTCEGEPPFVFDATSESTWTASDASVVDPDGKAGHIELDGTPSEPPDEGLDERFITAPDVLAGEGGIVRSVDEFQVILVDALGGDDMIEVEESVQKTVWIDAGPGNDRVLIGQGKGILADRTELVTRNDTREFAYTLAEDEGLVSTAAAFTGLTIDADSDVDHYLVKTASAGRVLAPSTSCDKLEIRVLSAPQGVDVENAIATVVIPDATERLIAAEVAPDDGRIDANVRFNLVVGSKLLAVQLNREATQDDDPDTRDNETVGDLVVDLNRALESALLEAELPPGSIVADTFQGKITIASMDPRVPIELSAADDGNVEELGFSPDDEGTQSVDSAANALVLLPSFRRVIGLSIDRPEDEDWFAFNLAERSPVRFRFGTVFRRIDPDAVFQMELLDADGLVLGSIEAERGGEREEINETLSGGRYFLRVTAMGGTGVYRLRPEIGEHRGDTEVDLGATTAGLELPDRGEYLLEVKGATPTVYDLIVSLDDGGLPEVTYLGGSADRQRRDVIVGGEGNDVLEGGPSEDWIFGGPGDDVLLGGYDRQASDLIFGGDGNDTFQIVPDELPRLGEADADDPNGETETLVPTVSDRFFGGDGEDRVLFVGSDNEERGDFVSIRYNTGLHRYEFGAFVEEGGDERIEFVFFQPRDVERTVIAVGKGDDEVHAEPEFTGFPGDAGEWGIDLGDFEQGATIAGLDIHGGEGDDLLLGGMLADRIDGGPGHDLILGYGGNDEIHGGEGDDLIAGNVSQLPDRLEFRERGEESTANDVFVHAAELPRPRLARDSGVDGGDSAGTLIEGLTLHAGDLGDWFRFEAPLAPRAFGGADRAWLTEEMIDVRTTSGETGIFEVALFAAVEEVPESLGELSGAPTEYFLHVRNREPGSAVSYTIEFVSAVQPATDASRATVGGGRIDVPLGETVVAVPLGNIDGIAGTDMVVSVDEPTPIASDLQQQLAPAVATIRTNIGTENEREIRLRLPAPLTRPDPAIGSQVVFSTPGDYNGDGIDDLAVAVSLLGPTKDAAVQESFGSDGFIHQGAYLLFGRPAAEWSDEVIDLIFAADVLLNRFSDDVTGDPIPGLGGDGGSSLSPLSVASANVDGDEYDDLIVGVPEYDENLGAAFVFQGRPTWPVLEELFGEDFTDDRSPLRQFRGGTSGKVSNVGPAEGRNALLFQTSGEISAAYKYENGLRLTYEIDGQEHVSSERIGKVSLDSGFFSSLDSRLIRGNAFAVTLEGEIFVDRPSMAFALKRMGGNGTSATVHVAGLEQESSVADADEDTDRWLFEDLPLGYQTLRIEYTHGSGGEPGLHFYFQPVFTGEYFMSDVLIDGKDPSSRPAFDGDPDHTQTTDLIRFSNRRGALNDATRFPDQFDEDFSARWTGEIILPQGNDNMDSAFSLSSDDGSWLLWDENGDGEFQDSEIVIDNSGEHEYREVTMEFATKGLGYQKFRVEFFNDKNDAAVWLKHPNVVVTDDPVPERPDVPRLRTPSRMVDLASVQLEFESFLATSADRDAVVTVLAGPALGPLQSVPDVRYQSVHTETQVWQRSIVSISDFVEEYAGFGFRFEPKDKRDLYLDNIRLAARPWVAPSEVLLGESPGDLLGASVTGIGRQGGLDDVAILERSTGHVHIVRATEASGLLSEADVAAITANNLTRVEVRGPSPSEGFAVRSAGAFNGGDADLLVTGMTDSFVVFTEDLFTEDLVHLGDAVESGQAVALLGIGDLHSIGDLTDDGFSDLAGAMSIERAVAESNTESGEYYSLRRSVHHVYAGGASSEAAERVELAAPDIVFEPESPTDELSLASFAPYSDPNDLLGIAIVDGSGITLYDAREMTTQNESEPPPVDQPTPPQPGPRDFRTICAEGMPPGDLDRLECTAPPVLFEFVSAPRDREIPPADLGLSSLTPGTIDGFALDGVAASQGLGAVVPIGDFNEDGFHDIVVHGPVVDGAGGDSYVMLGPIELGGVTSVQLVADLILDSEFGTPAGRLGNVDGAGGDDVVLVRDADTRDATEVRILSATQVAGGAAEPLVAVTTTHFVAPRALVLDWNGGGADEILIYSAEERSGDAIAGVYRVDGLPESPELVWTATLATGAAQPDVYEIIVPGDVNGDGIDDVIVAGGGSAYVYLAQSGRSGLIDLAVESALVLDGNFLPSVVGDLDGDGRDEVALNGIDASGGSLQIFSGASLSGGSAEPGPALRILPTPLSQNQARFLGKTVTLGATALENGANEIDLVVLESVLEGGAVERDDAFILDRVTLGTAVNPVEIELGDQRQWTGVDAPIELLAAAPAVDVDGDRVSDLFLGIPDFDTNEHSDAGRVVLIRGTPHTETLPDEDVISLENFTVTGSGTFLRNSGTGGPERFPEVGAYQIPETGEQWFDFRTLGDGVAGDSVRLTLLADDGGAGDGSAGGPPQVTEDLIIPSTESGALQNGAAELGEWISVGGADGNIGVFEFDVIALAEFRSAPERLLALSLVLPARAAAEFPSDPNAALRFAVIDAESDGRVTEADGVDSPTWSDAVMVSGSRAVLDVRDEVLTALEAGWTRITLLVAVDEEAPAGITFEIARPQFVGDTGATLEARIATDEARGDLFAASGEVLLRDLSVLPLRGLDAGTYFLRARGPAGARLAVTVNAPLSGRTLETAAQPDRDLLFGGAGYDALVGNSELDRILGGEDADVFNADLSEIRDLGTGVKESKNEVGEFARWKLNAANVAAIQAAITGGLLSYLDENGEPARPADGDAQNVRPAFRAPVFFADSNLQAAVARALSMPVTEKHDGTALVHEGIFADDLADLQHLNAAGMDIADTRGLEQLVGLRSLALSGSGLTLPGDVLAALRNLEHLSAVTIAVPEGFDGLSQLETLSLDSRELIERNVDFTKPLGPDFTTDDADLADGFEGKLTTPFVVGGDTVRVDLDLRVTEGPLSFPDNGDVTMEIGDIRLNLQLRDERTGFFNLTKKTVVRLWRGGELFFREEFEGGLHGYKRVSLSLESGMAKVELVPLGPGDTTREFEAELPGTRQLAGQIALGVSPTGFTRGFSVSIQSLTAHFTPAPIDAPTLGALATRPNLKLLSLRNQEILSLNALGGLHGVEILDLRDNLIRDVGPLLGEYVVDDDTDRSDRSFRVAGGEWQTNIQPLASATAVGGDVHFTRDPDGKVEWELTGLPAGVYDVLMAWPSAPERGRAEVTLLGQSMQPLARLAREVIDQRSLLGLEGDFYDQEWQQLFENVPLRAGTAMIELEALVARGAVAADAVRFVRQGSPADSGLQRVDLRGNPLGNRSFDVISELERRVAAVSADDNAAAPVLRSVAPTTERLLDLLTLVEEGDSPDPTFFEVVSDVGWRLRDGTTLQLEPAAEFSGRARVVVTAYDQVDRFGRPAGRSGQTVVDFIVNANAIYGKRFQDLDGSGAFDLDEGEYGIDGVRIQLYRQEGVGAALLGSTYTDPNGDFVFVLPDTAAVEPTDEFFARSVAQGGVIVDSEIVQFTAEEPLHLNVNLGHLEPIELRTPIPVEGSQVELAALIEDVGSDVQWAVDGPGAPLALKTSGPRGKLLSFTPPNNGEYTVTLTVEDETFSTTVEVENVAPVISAGGPASVYLRDLLENNGDLGRTVEFRDPGRDSLSGTVNFGDGTTPAPFNLGSPAANQDVRSHSLFHQYLASGSYVVTVTVNDGSGEVAESFEIDVTAVPAGLTFSETAGGTRVLEGEGADVYGVVLNTRPVADVEVRLVPDAQVTAVARSGGGDTLLFTRDNWDRLQFVEVRAVAGDGDESDEDSATIRHEITTADPNYATFYAESPDEAVLAITVFDADVTGNIESLTPFPSGFRVRLLAPFDASAINLYDAANGDLGDADVALTGEASGSIAGSIVLDTDLQGFTFVATGGPLAPDTYTVTVRGGETAFGGPPGEDMKTFVVEAVAPRVLSVSDIARGPRQSLDPVNPVDGGVGLPIVLSDGLGVSLVSFTVRWNPQLLDVRGIVAGRDLPPTAPLFVERSTPGEASVVVLPAFLPAGPVELASLDATVPDGTSLGDAHLIEIADVVLDSGNAATADSGVHAIAYLGDTTANGAYSALDAQRALRFAVGLDSGLDAYPLVDPVLIGDVSGNGRIGSLDATRILQEVLGFDPVEIPPIPGVVMQAAAEAGPSVTIPKDLAAAAGEVLRVPILIDDATQLESADIEIFYDPQVLELQDPGVWATDITEDATVTYRVEQDTGRLTIAAARIEPPTAGGGTLLELEFRINQEAAAGSSTTIDLARVVLNEGDSGTTSGSVPGPDESDGVVSVIGLATTFGETTTITGYGWDTVLHSDLSSNEPDDDEEEEEEVTYLGEYYSMDYGSYGS